MLNLVQFLLKLLGHLPLRVLRALAWVIGSLVWVARADAARVTERNLELCFPQLSPVDRRRRVRQSLANTAMLFTEAGLLWGRQDDRWRRYLGKVEGAQLLEPDPAGVGRMILLPHYGNWEVFGKILGPYSATILYAPPKITLLESLMRDARQREGAHLVPTDRSGMRSLIEALQTGGLVSLLPDQVPERSSGIYAPFYGQSTLTMTLAHRLYKKTRPRLLLGFTERTRNGFDVHIQTLQGVTPEMDASDFTQCLNQAVESVINRDPVQYQWEYKRFKRPEQGESPYKRINRGH